MGLGRGQGGEGTGAGCSDKESIPKKDWHMVWVFIVCLPHQSVRAVNVETACCSLVPQFLERCLAHRRLRQKIYRMKKMTETADTGSGDLSSHQWNRMNGLLRDVMDMPHKSLQPQVTAAVGRASMGEAGWWHCMQI